MKLTSDEVEKIRTALRKAFPAATGRLDLVVADADIGLEFAEIPGLFESRIQILIQHAVGQYRLTRLLRSAIKAAPDNPELAEIAEVIEQYFVFLPRFLPNRDHPFAAVEIERVLFKNVGFQNVREWLAKLDRLTRIVCRIEPQPRSRGIEGYGTGFLVGPDVIMTNDHVVSGIDGKSAFWGNREKAAQVKVRFDCEYTTEGKSTEGKEYKLAADYQILRCPVDQLDFALIRLDGRPANDMIRGKRREFVIPSSYQFEESEPLLILQHPQAEPMKLAFGSITSKGEWAPNCIAYSVNTEGGSSGSPCLTQDLAVAALHNRGSLAVNRGVLMSSILAHCNLPDVRTSLLAAGLGHFAQEEQSLILENLSQPSLSSISSAPQAGAAPTPPPMANVSQNANGLPQRNEKLREVWRQLAYWLRENYRVFNSFGPPSKGVGVDRSLWRRQKELVITPNNKSIAATLREYRELLPPSTEKIIHRMLDHLDAYAVSNSGTPVSYKQFIFPTEFSSLVGLGNAGHYSSSYDRSGIRLWAAWKMGACPTQVLKASLIGSILSTPLAARDVDILLLHCPSKGTHDAYDQWLDRAKTEAESLFGIPLHMSSFQSPQEEPEFAHFLQRYQEGRVRPSPSVIQPMEFRL